MSRIKTAIDLRKSRRWSYWNNSKLFKFFLTNLL